MAVLLPGAGYGEVTGFENCFFAIEKAGHFSLFEEDDLDSLIAVKFESPVLFSHRIPKTEAAESGECLRGNKGSWVVAGADGIEEESPLLHRFFLRKAAVNFILILSLRVNGLGRRR